MVKCFLATTPVMKLTVTQPTKQVSGMFQKPVLSASSSIS